MSSKLTRTTHNVEPFRTTAERTSDPIKIVTFFMEFTLCTRAQTVIWQYDPLESR